MNPWILRIIVLILAVAFIPVIVSGTATLVSNAIQGAGQGIHSLLRPLSMSGGGCQAGRGDQPLPIPHFYSLARSVSVWEKERGLADVEA